MLLPSAFSCDSAQPLRPAPHRSTRDIFSPPASPPTLSSSTALSNIMTTCRSLQSLIATPSATPSLSIVPPPSMAQLPTPPMTHASLPMKLRLRTRPACSESHQPVRDLQPRRITVKRPALPRGVNKRRRDEDDDMGREDVRSDEEDVASESEEAEQKHQPQSLDEEQQPVAPSTPKRARIAPEQLPLGLERSDFHNIHQLDVESESNTRIIDIEAEGDNAEWSAEDDRILVELVLEKLKLSKSEWQDCARSLGKDRHSLSRRWKSLIMKGEVGLKTRSSTRRARLHSTWR